MSPLPDPGPDAFGAATMRKVSLRLIPLIGLGYCAAYIDRVNISFAALQMNRDLHFSATAYGLGAGLFFLSYALCEIPSNLLLHRFGARRWLARIMITWGLLATGMLFIRTPLHFYVMRFLLGMAEAGFFPGVVYYFMLWFPPELRARAFARFYIALPLSSVIMGAIAGGLLNLNGRAHLAGWQWLFLVEGIPPILIGLLYLAILPDSPRTANWLTPTERDYILARTAAPAARQHASLAPLFRSPALWLVALLNLAMLTCNYAYTFTAPAILQARTPLGPARIGYVIAALSLVGALGMLLGARLSDRAIAHLSPVPHSSTAPSSMSGNNITHSSVPHSSTALPSMSGKAALRQAVLRCTHILPAATLLTLGLVAYGIAATPLFAVLSLGLVILGFNSMQGPVWSLPPTLLFSVTPRQAAAGIAAINMLGIAGGFLGPSLMGYLRDLTGSWQRGTLLIALFGLACIFIVLTLHTHLRQTAARQFSADAQPLL